MIVPRLVLAPCLAILLLAIVSSPVGALDDPPFIQEVSISEDSPVLLRAKGVEQIAPGSRFTLPMEVEIDRGWHIYGLHLNPEAGTPTSFVPTSLGPFTVAGRATEPPPKEHEVEAVVGSA